MHAKKAKVRNGGRGHVTTKQVIDERERGTKETETQRTHAALNVLKRNVRSSALPSALSVHLPCGRVVRASSAGSAAAGSVPFAKRACVSRLADADIWRAENGDAKGEARRCDEGTARPDEVEHVNVAGNARGAAGW